MQPPQQIGDMDKKTAKISTTKKLNTWQINVKSMQHAQRNGQRIYGGPPEGWAGPAPSRLEI